jgi:transposase
MVFVAAIRRYLPNATIVVDHFHVVKLANDTVSEVRRRIATMLRGRRGRAGDPEYTVRNLLRRNREDLSDRAFAKLRNTLVDLGGPRPDDPEDLDRQGGTTPPARRRRHRRRPVGDLSPALPVLHLVRRRRRPRTRTPRQHNPDVVGRRSRPSSTPRSRMRSARATTGSSNSTPQRLRLQEPREPTATNTLRNHPPSPRMPQPRSTSMTRITPS